MTSIKDYTGWKYKKGVTDCWTLVQDFYLRHYEIELPDYPIAGVAQHEIADYLEDVGLVLEVNEPFEHCIVHTSGLQEHVGINLDNRYYMHMSEQGVRCDRIGRKQCRFYRVLGTF